MKGNVVAGEPAVFFLVHEKIVDLCGEAVFILEPVVINYRISAGKNFSEGVRQITLLA